jgi:hypothetical protein
LGREQEYWDNFSNISKDGVGARPLGMGQAFTAVSDDVTSIYWNPAGLGFLKDKEVFCKPKNRDRFIISLYVFNPLTHTQSIS